MYRRVWTRRIGHQTSSDAGRLVGLIRPGVSFLKWALRLDGSECGRPSAPTGDIYSTPLAPDPTSAFGSATWPLTVNAGWFARCSMTLQARKSTSHESRFRDTRSPRILGLWSPPTVESSIGST